MIAIIIILVIAIIGMGMYIAYDKGIIFASPASTEEENKNAKEEQENTEKDNSEAQTTADSSQENNNVIAFDSSKCLNNEANYDYLLNAEFNHWGIEAIDTSNTKMRLRFHWDSVKEEFFELNSTNTGYDNVDINLTKRVSDVEIALIENGAGSEVIIFLMEDGTVEYIPLRKAFLTNNINFFGILPGVDNIVKIYTAVATTKSVGSHDTILAQKSDGTFYDLAPIIKNTGRYIRIKWIL